MNPMGVPVVSKCRDDADEPERRDADHKRQLAEAPELHHEYGEHKRDHERHLGEDSGVALIALLDRAADFEQCARRH